MPGESWMRPRVFSVVVSLGFALALSAQAYYLFSAHKLANTINTVVPEASLIQEDARSSVDAALLALQRRNLFGAPQTAPSQVMEKLPETRLALELRAVFMSDIPEWGGAIIAETSGQQEKLYFVGESLPKNAKLHRVRIDSVVIDRGGIYESLYFPLDVIGREQPQKHRLSKNTLETRELTNSSINR